MDKKYKIINQEEVRKLIDSFKPTIKLWHDRINPDYVFLADTGAFPFGYLIKSAWKEAYPEERVPSFFRVDPRTTPMGLEMGYHPKQFKSDEDHMKRWINFLKKRIKKIMLK